MVRPSPPAFAVGRRRTVLGTIAALTGVGAIVLLGIRGRSPEEKFRRQPVTPKSDLPLDHLAKRARDWRTVDDLPGPIAQFDSVFWEPLDTVSLREWIRQPEAVVGKRVLEIGTGTGLVALCCLQSGAAYVVATDINPSAVENARFNGRRLEFGDRLEVRRVPFEGPDAYHVIAPGERFDLILSNPPWEDAKPENRAEYALYDESFRLLRSLLSGLRDHLNPGGRALLAYGCVTAIRTIQRLAPEHGLRVRVLDDRDLDELPEVFLPGMLLEVEPE